MTSNCQVPTESSEDDVFNCAICTSNLRDPILLNCLHSVCRSCTPDATVNVTCPVCQVKTDTSTGKPNALVESLVHRSQILKNVFSCRHCIDEEKQEETAVAWCFVCQQSLCIDLQKYHKILVPHHEVMVLNEDTLLSELCRPPLRCCTKHGEELKLACFTCQDCRCYKCAHELCYCSSHDVLPLDDTDAVKRINKRIADLTRVHLDLNLTTEALQSFLEVPEKVACARQESLCMLQSAKKTVIESINTSYEKAENSLLTCWDTLISKSLGLRESVERLQARLAWTNKYCQLALSSKGMAEVFPQLEAIFSSLCSLLVEARHFKVPVDPLKMVSLSVYLPSDLDLITGDWLGLANIVSEDFTSSVTDVPAGYSNDYYTRKVTTLKELEQHLQHCKEDAKRHENVQQSLEQLQSEMKSKDLLLIKTQNEVKKLLHIQKEQQERERRTTEQLQLQLQSKTQQLDLAQSEVKKYLEKQKVHQQEIERQGRNISQLQLELQSKTQQLDLAQIEVKKYLEKQKVPLEKIERQRRTITQLKSES